LSTTINAGITVGIGADDPNANQNVTLVQDMKIAALTQAHKYGSNSITPEQILEMATLGGARAAGLEDAIESIEVG
jgi:cytosine/adenosine deaminase-related metal-dependent hydrolase